MDGPVERPAETRNRVHFSLARDGVAGYIGVDTWLAGASTKQFPLFGFAKPERNPPAGASARAPARGSSALPSQGTGSIRWPWLCAYVVRT